MVLGLLGMSLGSPGIDNVRIYKYMGATNLLNKMKTVGDKMTIMEDDDDNLKDDTHCANIVKKTIQKP